MAEIGSVSIPVVPVASAAGINEVRAVVTKALAGLSATVGLDTRGLTGGASGAVREVQSRLNSLSAAGPTRQFSTLGATASQEVGRATAAVNGLSTKMVGLGVAGAAIGGALLAGVKGFSDSFVAAGAEVLKFQRLTGDSAEDASRLRFVAEASRVGFDQMSTALVRLSKNGDALKTLGISFTDLEGKQRGSLDILADIADRYNALGTAQEKTALTTSLFGRGAQGLGALLSKGADGIRELAKESDKLGFTFNDEKIAKVQEYRAAQLHLKETLEGLQLTIGSKVLPTFLSFEKGIERIGSVIASVPLLPDLLGNVAVGGGGLAILGGSIALIGAGLRSLSAVSTGAVSFIRGLGASSAVSAEETAALGVAGEGAAGAVGLLGESATATTPSVAAVGGAAALSSEEVAALALAARGAAGSLGVLGGAAIGTEVAAGAGAGEAALGGFAAGAGKAGAAARTFAVDSAGIATEVAATGSAVVGTTGALAGLRAGLASTLSGVTGVGLAGAAAFLSWKTAIDENNKGFDEAIRSFTVGSDLIRKSALGFSNPKDLAALTAAKGTASEIADILAKMETVGPRSAVDKIKNGIGLFGEGDETANRIAAQKQELKDLGATIESLPLPAARALFEGVRSALIETTGSTAEADRILGGLKDKLASREAEDAMTSATADMAAGLDAFGFKLDETKGKFGQWADSLSAGLGPMQAVVNGMQSVQDAQSSLQDAESKLADIRAGKSDGIVSATKALNDAKAQLNEDLAKTGPGSEAAESALESLHSALKALHDAKVEAGREAKPGDFFEDNRAAVADAEKRVQAAQKKLNDINAGKSDQVIADRKRIVELQQKLNEEIAKTGAGSKAEADAVKAVEDAKRRVFDAQIQEAINEANLQDELEKHPGAVQAVIQKVDELVARGKINLELATAWKKAILDGIAASGNLPTPPPAGTPGTPGAGAGSRPAGTPAGTSGAPRKDRPAIDPTTAANYYGLPKTPKKDDEARSRNVVITDGGIPTGVAQAPDGGGVWYRYDGKQWVPHYADGGLFDPGSGEVSRFADGGLTPKKKPTGAFNFPALATGAPVAFPTAPAILPNRPGGLSKVVAFEGTSGYAEGFVPTDPAKRPQAIAVMHELAQRLGMESLGVAPRRFADGGFIGRPPARPAAGVPRPAAIVAADITPGERAIRDEINALRGELVATVRDIIRAAAGPGATEPLAPYLREIARNTAPQRHAGPSSGDAMASSRRAQAGLAR